MLMRMPPEPSAPAPVDHYAFGDEDAMRRIFQLRTLQSCGDFLLPHLRAGMHLLDCGSGLGELTVELAEHLRGGRVVGIDADQSAVLQAQRLAAERRVHNVEFRQADVYALPHIDGTFDAVYSHGLISHLGDPVRALKEARRVLKPGGVIGVADNVADACVVSPTDTVAERWVELLIRVQAHHGVGPKHVRNLLVLLLDAGFERVEGHGGAEVFGTRDRLRVGARGMAAIARRPQFVATVIEQGWADHTELTRLAEAIPAWAEHPAAYLALLKCSAVGWVPEP
jgi:SAM-dependent methyltransferase